MSVNINSIKTQSEEIAQNVGIVLMSAATILGMVEVSDHQKIKIALPNQPILATAGDVSQDSNPMRREKDEVSNHYVNYSTNLRTPARSGRL